MLQNIKLLYGKKIGATDGDIGHVKDFYFDDITWMVRYLVVDTGTWLAGRQILLPPQAFGPRPFGKTNADPKLMQTNLTRRQIEDSPSIETHKPVSRQHEEAYYNYYGWPAYWMDAGMVGGISLPPGAPIADQVRPSPERDRQRDDPHLRSAKAVDVMPSGPARRPSASSTATWSKASTGVSANSWWRPVIGTPEKRFISCPRTSRASATQNPACR